MINATLAERPTETREELDDLKAEKDYIDLLVKAAEAITKLPEYRNSDGEMAKTMVIKRFIADNEFPIRNRNAPRRSRHSSRRTAKSHSTRRLAEAC